MKDPNNRVVIIGGGPAGSALGCYLSKAGIPNLIFEGEIHPRPHVGESLVPATTRQLREIGFLETMEREGFVRKFGASWHPPRRQADINIQFAEFPQEGVNQNYTYHVDRARFDLLLLKHADSLGSKVYQGTQVREVLFDGECGTDGRDTGGRATGVRVAIAGQEIDVPCAMVVDASGRGTLAGRQLGWKKSDPLFNQFVVHAWFEGVDRGARPDNIHIHFLPVERGWVWQIPVTETQTSIGVVAEKRVFEKAGKDFEGWFTELIASAPDPTHALRDAVRINDFTVEADYSYCMDHFVGDGLLLVGDAARFVDPIFSSGISIALTSAQFARDQIMECFAAADFSKEKLRPYEDRLRKGVSIWYEFIGLYYKLMPLFTMFIEHGKYRKQLFQLLQGEVYDLDEVPVLDAMRRFIEGVETSERSLLASALDTEISVDEILSDLRTRLHQSEVST